jgi:hypothetical protein
MENAEDPPVTFIRKHNLTRAGHKPRVAVDENYRLRIMGDCVG